MSIRKAHEALSGDVYSEGTGNWIVRDVEVKADNVGLLLSVGRTDPGTWHEFDTDADLSLWRAGEDENGPQPLPTGPETQKVPQSVQEAIEAFREAERAELFSDRKRLAERNAVLRMVVDDRAKDWQAFYHDETDRILREFQEKRSKEGL